jgi:hypothetical protein
MTSDNITLTAVHSFSQVVTEWLARMSDESLLHPVPAGETNAVAFLLAFLHKNCDFWFLFLTKYTRLAFKEVRPSAGDLRDRRHIGIQGRREVRGLSVIPAGFYGICRNWLTALVRIQQM